MNVELQYSTAQDFDSHRSVWAAGGSGSSWCRWTRRGSSWGAGWGASPRPQCSPCGLQRAVHTPVGRLQSSEQLRDAHTRTESVRSSVTRHLTVACTSTETKREHYWTLKYSLLLAVNMHCTEQYCSVYSSQWPHNTVQCTDVSTTLFMCALLRSWLTVAHRCSRERVAPGNGRAAWKCTRARRRTVCPRRRPESRCVRSRERTACRRWTRGRVRDRWTSYATVNDWEWYVQL